MTNFTQLFNNSAQARVLDAMLDVGAAASITTTELVELTKLSRRAVMENLKRLEAIGLVTKTGNGKLAFLWSVNVENPIGMHFSNIYYILTHDGRKPRVSSKHVKTDKQKASTKRSGKGAKPI